LKHAARTLLLAPQPTDERRARQRGNLVPIALACAALAAGCGSIPEQDDRLAFVDVNLALTGDCEVDLGNGDPASHLPSGLYDISGGSGYCERDYETRLRIHSFHAANMDDDRRTEIILQVHSAEVTLRAQDGEALDFGDRALPNPFQQVTGVSLFPSHTDEPSIASITIQTIPAAYAPRLATFVDLTVVADIQLFSTTTYDVDVDFEPLSYPIQICDGCLTACASTAPGDDEAASECDDDAGQDGRICYDTGC
jgi:hypothetical protein